MTTKKSIFVDIDGTIADIQHRVHHIDNEKGSAGKDWEAFYADIQYDQPIYQTINLVNSLHKQGWYVILITGRDAERRAATQNWLLKYGVMFDMLLMRPIGIHTTDVEIKRAWLKKMRDGELVIKGVQIPNIVIEDRKKVIDMWREEGLVALHCDEGDF
jgi:predicted secreted acid phosphatase